jgi:hypothetical protein
MNLMSMHFLHYRETKKFKKLWCKKIKKDTNLIKTGGPKKVKKT